MDNVTFQNSTPFCSSFMSDFMFKHPNKCAALRSHIFHLIDMFGTFSPAGYTLDISWIDDHELGVLTASYLDLMDRDVMECFYESVDPLQDEIANTLINMLKEKSIENRARLADMIFSNAVMKHKNAIQQIIDECCSEKTERDYQHSGYSRFVDPETGESIWTRPLGFHRAA